jgi:DNA-directed RNA polymerase subunit K
MIEKLSEKFTKYEIARILGARSLQLAMDAPILLKLTKEEEEELNYDSLRIAEKELESGVLPITVRRPLPKKSEKVIKKLTDEEIKEKLEREKLKAESGESHEEGEEGEIAKEGEIMELAKPEDEEEVEEVNENEEM